MNTYEIKILERRERYATLAEKKQEESNQAYQKAKSMGDMIPFGQPILVGHHSERGHRKALDTINNNMRKSIELDGKVDYYKNKAEQYGTHGISSEDPEALQKLKEKLLDAQTEHSMLKQKRKQGKAEAYELSNSNGRIRAIKQRIETMEKMQEREEVSKKGEGWVIFEDDSRIQYKSDTIPDEPLRNDLKRYGFKWSPTRKAWVRLITPNALYATKRLINSLN